MEHFQNEKFDLSIYNNGFDYKVMNHNYYTRISAHSIIYKLRIMSSKLLTSSEWDQLGIQMTGVEFLEM